VLFVGGGAALAYLALRGGAGETVPVEGPGFVVKSTASKNLLEQLDGAEVLVVDAAGSYMGGGAASVGRVPAGTREVRRPLPDAFTRFRVRFRLRTEGPAPATWHEMGPYEVGASAPGTRVLQVGLVFEDGTDGTLVDLDGVGGNPGEEPPPRLERFVARVTVRVRVPSGGEMWETLGTMKVQPER
jgi:hypothetical protein